MHLKLLELLRGGGGAPNHPTVNCTVGHHKSVGDLLHFDITDATPTFDCLIDANFHLGIALDLLIKEFVRKDAHKAVLVSDDLGLGGGSGSGRSYNQDFWWLSGSAVTESNLQNANDVTNYLILTFAVAIVEVDEIVEVALHLTLVHIPLPVGTQCMLLALFFGQLGVDFTAVCH